MKLIDKINGIHFLYYLGNVYAQNDREIMMLNRNTSIPINPYNGSLSKGYFYKIDSNKISLYDSQMILQKEIFIEKPSIFFSINEDYFVVTTILNDVKYNNFYYKNEIIAKRPRFFGKILDKNARLNFHEGVFSNPNYFRFSDLLDETTYWEYQCEEGLQTTNQWIVRGDYLLFCEHKKLEAAGKLVKIHLPTGNIKWEVEIPNTFLLYNEAQGLFTSFWAAKEIGSHYQIIDIDHEKIEIGKAASSYDLENVNTFGETQYLHENKLYFSDQVNSYGNDLRPIRFGCFNIVTKEVEFLQEVPEALASQFSQLIYHEDKLYLRTTDNVLYIYCDKLT